jgi:PadR family transcriptional regulator PadR
MSRIDRELMRGAGPLAVLKLLERTEMYGYELVEALARRTEGVLDMGQSTLYPMLYNLEAQGLITGAWRTSDPGGGGGAGAGGRDRKYYKLTGKGRKRLAKDTEQFKRLNSALIDLGILTPNAPARGA